MVVRKGRMAGMSLRWEGTPLWWFGVRGRNEGEKRGSSKWLRTIKGERKMAFTRLKIVFLFLTNTSP